MLRFIAKSGALALGAGAGLFVFSNMRAVFDGYWPWIAAGAVGVIVFMMFYFPLFRPITDIVSDRLSVAVRRGRHFRSGSGLDDLPERPSRVERCAICGAAEGPICPVCRSEMDRGSRSRF